jgi:hypothetical protein
VFTFTDLQGRHQYLELTTETRVTYSNDPRKYFFFAGMMHSCPPFKQRLHGSVSVFASHFTLNFLQRAQAPDLKMMISESTRTGSLDEDGRFGPGETWFEI